jgi:serine/threonine-protein kinase RsbW
MAHLKRVYSSDLGHLADMRAFLRQACGDAWGTPADEPAVEQLELALSEAATNVIRHAYQGKEGLPIEMVIEATGDQVCLSLYHQGRGFDPGAVAPPAFDGSREGGFGLFLIAQSVDEVRYFEDARGWRVVRLVKKRPRAGRGG